MRLPGTYISPAETGLYYLQSRYYDPEIGRFVNADGVVAGASGSIQGYNMFAYCFNNPVNMSDPSGNWPQWVKNVAKAVDRFITKLASALSESLTASREIGFGLGADASVHNVDVGLKAVIVGDEWVQDGKGNETAVRKSMITASVGSSNVLMLEGEAGYSVPLKSAEEKGLLFAEGGSWDADIAVATLGVKRSTDPKSNNDHIISYGLSFYFVLGGGFEINLNVDKFIEVWEKH